MELNVLMTGRPHRVRGGPCRWGLDGPWRTPEAFEVAATRPRGIDECDRARVACRRSDFGEMDRKIEAAQLALGGGFADRRLDLPAVGSAIRHACCVMSGSCACVPGHDHAARVHRTFPDHARRRQPGSGQRDAQQQKEKSPHELHGADYSQNNGSMRRRRRLNEARTFAGPWVLSSSVVRHAAAGPCVAKRGRRRVNRIGGYLLRNRSINGACARKTVRPEPSRHRRTARCR